MRPPRTFYEYLLREKVKAKKASENARRKHAKSVKETGGDGYDQNYYDLLITDADESAVLGILSAYRHFKAKGKL